MKCPSAANVAAGLTLARHQQQPWRSRNKCPVLRITKQPDALEARGAKQADQLATGHADVLVRAALADVAPPRNYCLPAGTVAAAPSMGELT